MTDRPAEQKRAPFAGCVHRGQAADDPLDALDALAVELGKLAAQREFGKAVEDEVDTDISSPQGRVP